MQIITVLVPLRPLFDRAASGDMVTGPGIFSIPSVASFMRRVRVAKYHPGIGDI
jgi:hypothetical protein